MREKEKDLSEFINVFRPDPLDEKDFDYYQKTAMQRSGESYEFHEELYNRLSISKQNIRCLIVGHMGCGKSTELNKLSVKLRDNSYNVIQVDAKTAFDVNNISYVDLMISIAYCIIEFCKDKNLKINKHLISALYHALSSKMISSEELKASELSVDGNVEAGGGIPLLGIFKFLVELSSQFRYASSRKKELRLEMEVKITDIINAINAIINEMYEITDQKTMLLIDGFEKCNLEQIKKLFNDGSAALAALELHLIMCCPIGVQRSTESQLINAYYDYLPIPMIKIYEKPADSNYKKYDEGVQVLKDLILKRVEESCFEEDILEYIILKTGGSLRDLTYSLREIAFKAYLAGKEKIDMEQCNKFFKGFRSDIFLRIEKGKELYPAVRRIYEGDHALFNDDKISELLFSGAVFEYNGERWCDLHPLLREHIKEIGIGCLDD